LQLQAARISLETSGLPVIQPLQLADRIGPAPDMLQFMSRSKAFVVRITLCVCGVLSILVGRTYGSLRLFYPSDRWVWTVFSVTLVIAGIITLVAGLLPDSWTRAGLGQRLSQGSMLRLAVRLLAVFAAISYGVVALLALLHPSTRLPPVAVYSLCPSCVLTATVDPSLASLLLVLAPLSAAAYGSVGAVIGLSIRLVHK
jgi:hypothetical protein